MFMLKMPEDIISVSVWLFTVSKDQANEEADISETTTVSYCFR